MTNKFVKPKIDQVLYLFSENAEKNVVGGKALEYRWNIPNINLNNWGKITMVGRYYKTFNGVTAPLITRIKNVSSKNNFESYRGNGVILNIGQWHYQYPSFTEYPSVPLEPQTLNSITLSFSEELTNPDSGIWDTNIFVVILKITEDDIPLIKWGNSKAVNVRQMEIPTYNNN